MNRVRAVCFAVTLCLLALVCGVDLRAQEVTATVTGTVTDTTGSAVTGASVAVKSVERGVVYSAVTNDLGLYRTTNLPIGNYEVKVMKDGFQTADGFKAVMYGLRAGIFRKYGLDVQTTLVPSGAAASISGTSASRCSPPTPPS